VAAMKRLKASVRKIQKGIDDSFRITLKDGTTYVNKTCSQGKMVTVDYFALCDLLEYFENTQKQSNRVMVARDMLKDAFWGQEPEDKEKIIREVLRGR
jgi:hypothetical protein